MPFLYEYSCARFSEVSGDKCILCALLILSMHQVAHFIFQNCFKKDSCALLAL